MSQYSEAMGGIVNFSIVSLENWHMAPNSVHYVLGFWERLIKGIPYSNCEKRDHNLNLYSPQIMQAYIKVKRMGAMLWPRLCLGGVVRTTHAFPLQLQSRLDSVTLVLDGLVNDPFEDKTVRVAFECTFLLYCSLYSSPEPLTCPVTALCTRRSTPFHLLAFATQALDTQLKQAALIARCQYSSSIDMLTSAFDPIAEAYMQRLSAGGGGQDRETQILEGAASATVAQTATRLLTTLAVSSSAHYT